MNDHPMTKLKPPAWWQIWNNPIFRRYTRSRLRARGLGVSLVITLVITGFIYLVVPAFNKRMDDKMSQRLEREINHMVNQRNGTPVLPEMAARWLAERQQVRPPNYYERTPIFPLLMVQGIILFLFGTGQVAGGMTAEADEGSVDYQRLAPMSPLSKTLGYLFGLPVREYVLFLSTLPLTALCLWQGAVPASAWVPVYGIFLTSVLLYHLTGLVSGTVVKNKRWAFLLSMGLIFTLYTLVPQGARFGFPFVKYLTLWPVLIEHAVVMAPKSAEMMMLSTGMIAGTEVPFFNVSFSDLTFTLMVQGSFIVTMLVMVWRKWKRAESHLLSKFWGLVVFGWIHLLIVGNAVPMAEDGDLFPSQNFQRTQLSAKIQMEMERRHVAIPKADPHVWEGSFITLVFAINLMLVIMLLVIMMTPTADNQVQGLRRAGKRGRMGAPLMADESSALPVVLLLVGAGAAAWYWFERSILGAHWFDSKMLGGGNEILAALRIFLVLGLTLLAFHAMLEARGGKRPFLAVIFLGVVPLMAAMVVQLGHREVSNTALSIAGISPFTQLAIATEMMLPPKFQLPEPYHHRAALIFYVWVSVMSLAVAWHWLQLKWSWQTRRRGKDGTLGQDLMDHIPGHVGKPIGSTVVEIR
jgi:hypothetical protein